MSDIGWCNHITVTHGVCGLCGQYVGSSEQDAARDNEIAALRERVEELEEHRAELIETLDNRTAGWREHAEKVEWERDEWKSCAQDNRALLTALEELADTREDIKALAMVLRDYYGLKQELGYWQAHDRIRDRKLLEVE